VVASGIVQFGILGPIVVSGGDQPVLITRRQQALLADLLIHANRPVPADRLIEDLWPGQGATKTLHVAVMRLRKALGEAGGVLRTAAGGYLLEVAPGELDSELFAQLTERGERALAAGDAAGAADVLRTALALWRGPALAEIAYESFAQPEARRLEELRLVAVEARVAAELQLERHASLVPELERLLADHPHREGLAAHLMLALYRCGRQADALDVYARTRAHLVTELGLEPGPALSALQSQILTHAPELEPSCAAARLPPRPVLVGRDADVAEVSGLLAASRLVTVVGVGGVGKTSLALEVAHRGNASAFAELAPVGDAAAVPEAVLRALGGTPDPDVSPAEALLRLAATRDGLLVLDNFEHVTAAAPLVADLLGAAPRLNVLVTSRAALDLRGEQRYPLEPLPPDAAAELFVERARARDPALRLSEADHVAVAEVCSRVAALPLAIELAAARAGVLSPREIAARLSEGLGTGPVDAPARHRSLHATLDWSHQLLDTDEATAFARMAVFVGGCTVAAAEAVTEAALATLDQLVAKSMIVRRGGPDGTTRLALLEPVREYAAERLAERSDREEVERRHAGHYLAIAKDAEAGLMAGDQVLAGRRLDADAANIRAALAWARDAGDAERVLDAAIALEEWWFERGLWSEGVGWLDWALAHGSEALDPAVRGDGHLSIAYLLWPEADTTRTEAEIDRAVADFERAGDTIGMAWAHMARAMALSYDSRSAGAAYAEEALRLAEGTDDRTRGAALRAVAVTAADPERARIATEAAAIHLERAGDVRTLARLWEEVGQNALIDGDLDRAREDVKRALALAGARDDTAELGWTLALDGLVALEAGEDDAARSRLRDALERCRATGIRTGLPQILLGLAALAGRDGDAVTAARLVGAAHAARSPRMAPDALERRLEAAARIAEPRVWEREVEAGAILGSDAAIELALRPRGE
jgi:predicted ATPase/DNA-binding SARP family transcriptional activator